MYRLVFLGVMSVSFLALYALSLFLLAGILPRSESLYNTVFTATFVFFLCASILMLEIKRSARIETGAQIFLQHLAVVDLEAIKKVQQVLAEGLQHAHLAYLKLQSGATQISDDGACDAELGAKVCALRRRDMEQELKARIKTKNHNLFGVTRLLAEFGIIKEIPRSYEDYLPPKA